MPADVSDFELSVSILYSRSALIELSEADEFTFAIDAVESSAPERSEINLIVANIFKFSPFYLCRIMYYIAH